MKNAGFIQIQKSEVEKRPDPDELICYLRGCISEIIHKGTTLIGRGGIEVLEAAVTAMEDQQDVKEKSNMTAADKILEAGYESVVIFSDFSYDDALIGVTEDERAVYDFDKMVDWLMEEEGWSQEEAIEWIEYNTIRALPYMGPKAPIVMYPLAE